MGRPQDVFMFVGHTPKEASYGAAVANGSLDKFYKLTGPGLVMLSKNEETDQDEIKGHPYVTDGGGTVIEDRTKGSIEFKGNVDLLIFWLAMLHAKITTTGAGDPFTHVTKWPGSGVFAPWSTSIIQGSDRNQTTTFRKYDGVFPNSVEVTIEKPGSILTKVELMGDGSDSDASAVAAPAVNSAIDGNRLFFEHLVTMGLGPAAESVLTSFRKLTLKWSADVQQIARPDKLTKIAEIHYGKDAPKFEATLTLKGRRGDTVFNYWRNRTKLQFNMLLERTVGTRSLQLQGNSVRVMGDAGDIESFDGIDHVLTLPLRFEYVTADLTPYTITAKNAVATYLA